jgi:hypothetical protein
LSTQLGDKAAGAIERLPLLFDEEIFLCIAGAEDGT